ncbi:MAG: hypothetical protein II921_07560 [Treponema sp.]|nr:hypothetical protein [Treponema sp.]
MNAKRFFKTAMTVAIFLILFSLVASVMERHDTYTKFKSFFSERKTDYDVYFLGTSHVLNGVDPMILWHNWGITSYNLGWNCNTLGADYWQLRLASKIHKPKVVVVDILGLYDDMKIDYSSNYVFAHGILDPFRLSPEKSRAIMDLFDSPKTRLEFYLPFSLYHNRWQEFSMKKVRKNVRNYLLDQIDEQPTKGYDPKIGVKTPQSFCPYMADYNGRETVSIAYARKIISFCRENGIALAFMHIPFSVQEKMGAWKAAFEKILEQENIPFIDMSTIVDFETDQYDLDYHLNAAGARKATDYIGSFLREKNMVPAHREKNIAEKWDADYESYESYYDTLISAQTDMASTLMLVNHPSYRTQILTANGFEFGATEKKQIAQLGNSVFLLRAKTRQDFDVTIEVFREADGKSVAKKYYRREFVSAQ